MAFVWDLTTENIHLPLGCLQGDLVHLLPADSLSEVSLSAIPQSERERAGSATLSLTFNDGTLTVNVLTVVASTVSTLTLTLTVGAISGGNTCNS